MRLTVLGGSAAGPNAGAGCSAYLLREGDTAIVIDLGPGTVPELKKHIDPRELAGIVISHPHLDHVLDVATLRYALAYSPHPIERPIPLWVPFDTPSMLDRIAEAFDPDDAAKFYSGIFDIRFYDQAATPTIGPFSIHVAPTVHYVPGYAMRVVSDHGGALGYTADTGPTANLDTLFAGVAVLISEATLLDAGPEPDPNRGHLTAAEAGALAARAGARTLVLTHLWEELGFDHLRKRAATEFAGRIEIARPGIMLDL